MKRKGWRTVRDHYIQWFGQYIYIRSPLRDWCYRLVWCEEHDAGLIIYRGCVIGRRKVLGFVPRKSNGDLTRSGFDATSIPEGIYNPRQEDRMTPEEYQRFRPVELDARDEKEEV